MRGRFAIVSRRLAGWAIASSLLAGAGWWAREALFATASSLGPGDALPVIAIGAAVALALLLSAEVFGLALRLFPHDPAVSRPRMLRLVTVSALLNFLPLPRAGAWGRAAYLKARHGLALRDSLLTLGLVSVVSVAVYAVVAGTLVAASSLGVAARMLLAGAGTIGLSLGCRLVPMATRQAGPGEGASTRRVPRACLWAWPLLRGADLSLAALRLVLACGVVGVPLSFPDAMLLASGGLVVRLAGLTPNGLGLSEAAVAALAAALTPLESAGVAAAALLDRAVEIVVVALAAAAARPGELVSG